MGTRNLALASACYSRTIGSIRVESDSARCLAEREPRLGLDAGALRDLSLGRIPGARRTAFDGVERLAPTFHDCVPTAEKVGWRQAVARIRQALDACLGQYLERAPLAVLLSGGLDSTVIAERTVLVSRRAGLAPPLLLTIAYPGLDCDEFGAAATTAARLGCAVRPIDARQLSVEPNLDRWIEEHDSPLIDPHEGAVRAALRVAREHGCEFVATGWGGDEILGGRGVDVDLVRLAAPLAAADVAVRSGRARRRGVLRSFAGLVRRVVQDPKGRLELIAQEFASGTLAWRLDEAAQTARSQGVRLLHPLLDRTVMAWGVALSSQAWMQARGWKGPTRSLLETPGIGRSRFKSNLEPYLWRMLVQEQAGWRKRLTGCEEGLRRLNAAVSTGNGVVSFWRFACVREFERLWLARAS